MRPGGKHHAMKLYGSTSSGRFIPVQEVHNSPCTGPRLLGEFVATRNMRAAARIRTLGRPARKYMPHISAIIITVTDGGGSTGNASREVHGSNFRLDTGQLTEVIRFSSVISGE
jgi:hypothetical protein